MICDASASCFCSLLCFCVFFNLTSLSSVCVAPYFLDEQASASACFVFADNTDTPVTASVVIVYPFSQLAGSATLLTTIGSTFLGEVATSVSAPTSRCVSNVDLVPVKCAFPTLYGPSKYPDFSSLALFFLSTAGSCCSPSMWGHRGWSDSPSCPLVPPPLAFGCYNRPRPPSHSHSRCTTWYFPYSLSRVSIVIFMCAVCRILAR